MLEEGEGLQKGMVPFKALASALFKKRPRASRWPYFFPALIAGLFVGHAYQDGGMLSALIYVGILAISVLTALRPTVLGWSILLLLFLTYGIAVLFSRSIGPLNERALFMSMGLVPVLLMYVGRPYKREGFLGTE